MRSWVLNACPSCARQLDVTHLAPSTKVRCDCGAVWPTKRLDPKPPRAVNCSNCGAAIAEGSLSCSYCSSKTTIEERWLSSVCPSCGGRLAADAKHCMTCGIAIAPQPALALPAGADCPRCSGELRSRALPDATVTECAQCGGLWLTPAAFERMCRTAEERELSLPHETPGERFRKSDADAVAYLPCVVCDDRMMRRNYGGSSGIIVDVCREHGVWLDHAELERVIAFIRAGGLLAARRREMETLRADAERARANAYTPPPILHGPPLRELDVDLGPALRWLHRAMGRLIS
jgi:Zn-finger nucleic acid-binding protein